MWAREPSRPGGRSACRPSSGAAGSPPPGCVRRAFGSVAWVAVTPRTGGGCEPAGAREALALLRRLQRRRASVGEPPRWPRGHTAPRGRRHCRPTSYHGVGALEQLLITLGTIIPGVKPIVLCAIPALRLDDPALRGTRKLTAELWTICRARGCRFIDVERALRRAMSSSRVLRV